MNLEGKYVTVTTQDECEAVQKKAFELVYSWRNGNTDILWINMAMNINFKPNKQLTFSSWSLYQHDEIPLQTLLSL